MTDGSPAQDTAGTTVDTVLPDGMVAWLADNVGVPRGAGVEQLVGGNANAGFLVSWDGGRLFLRTPPDDPIDPTAHNFHREHRVLRALQDTAVPAPQAIALCDDESVPRAPFLVMEAIDGISMTTSMPYAEPGAIGEVGEELMKGLAAVHSVDWRAVGLSDFGRPEGFLGRQVGRWTAQFERSTTRELPVFHRVAVALEGVLPSEGEVSVMHGDFHLDNTLFDHGVPRLLAIIDWEMATIGDPLLDLGLVLAFWGERPISPFALPTVQAVSREAGAPTRDELAAHYARVTGRGISMLPAYMALAFFKLAAIIEGAYTLHLQGRLDTDYACGLRDDVPRLLAEAEAHLTG